ncbi:hypothetical protein SY88_11360 [Clostridiales bacterium PH28_bin88]|nr:hypothetical protein SY88_11360 [Clostridiales bacterium PH28_bin88]
MCEQDSRDLVEESLQVLANMDQEARQVKQETGRPLIGYLCSYTPVELIIAAGCHPVRIFGATGGTSSADRDLQAFTCSFARACWEQLKNGFFNYLDGIVFPYTCDSLRAVAEICRGKKLFDYFYFLNLPTRLDSRDAGRYLYAELQAFRQSLRDFSGQPVTDADVTRATAAVNRIRDLLRVVLDHRGGYPGLTGREALAVAASTFVRDHEKNEALLDRLAGTLQGRAGSPGALLNRARVVLSGSMLDSLEVPDLIEEAGGLVVGDDLCTASRYVQGQVPINDGTDVMVALAERYLHRVPCAAKYPAEQRVRYLLEEAKNRNAAGAVFILQKFCESHAFDYPYIKERLGAAGIPSLLVEVEAGTAAGGQLKTRIGAFIEMIGGASS